MFLDYWEEKNESEYLEKASSFNKSTKGGLLYPKSQAQFRLDMSGSQKSDFGDNETEEQQSVPSKPINSGRHKYKNFQEYLKTVRG